MGQIGIVGVCRVQCVHFLADDVTRMHGHAVKRPLVDYGDYCSVDHRSVSECVCNSFVRYLIGSCGKTSITMF